MTAPEKQKKFREVVDKIRRASAFSEAMADEPVTKGTALTLLQLADDAAATAKKFREEMIREV